MFQRGWFQAPRRAAGPCAHELLAAWLDVLTILISPEMFEEALTVSINLAVSVTSLALWREHLCQPSKQSACKFFSPSRAGVRFVLFGSWRSNCAFETSLERSSQSLLSRSVRKLSARSNFKPRRCFVWLFLFGMLFRLCPCQLFPVSSG